MRVMPFALTCAILVVLSLEVARADDAREQIIYGNCSRSHVLINDGAGLLLSRALMASSRN